MIVLKVIEKSITKKYLESTKWKKKSLKILPADMKAALGIKL